MQGGQHPLCSDRLSALSTSSRALLRLELIQLRSRRGRCRPRRVLRRSVRFDYQ